MQLKLSQVSDVSVPSRSKYQGLAQTWTKLRNRDRYKALAANVGNPHFVKILEETIGNSGLYPHLHVIWLFDESVSKAEASAFLAEVRKRWCDTANTHSLGAESAGQYSGPLSSDNVPGIGHYFFKHGYFDLAQQPQFSDVLDPFGALRRHLLTGEVEFLIFWLDFEAASRNQIRVRFSSDFPIVT